MEPRHQIAYPFFWSWWTSHQQMNADPEASRDSPVDQGGNLGLDMNWREARGTWNPAGALSFVQSTEYGRKLDSASISLRYS